MDFAQIIKGKLNDNQQKVWKGISPFSIIPRIDDCNAYKKKHTDYITRLGIEREEYNKALDLIIYRERQAELNLEQKKERRKKTLFFFLKLPILPILILKSIIVGLIKWAKTSEISAYTVISLILAPLAIIGALLLTPCIIKTSDANSNTVKWINFGFIFIYFFITYVIGYKRIDNDTYSSQYKYYVKDAIYIKIIDTLIIVAYMVGVTFLTLWLQSIFMGTSVSTICHLILSIIPLVGSIVVQIGGQDDYADYFVPMGIIGLIILSVLIIMAVVLIFLATS